MCPACAQEADRRTKRQHKEAIYLDSVREEVLAKHGGQCVDCGAIEGAADGRALHIHHLDETGLRGLRRTLFANNDMRNLVPLCAACHQRRHRAEQMKEATHVAT